MSLILKMSRICRYSNDLKYLGTHVWGNSVGPDQTAPEETFWLGSTQFGMIDILSAPFECITILLKYTFKFLDNYSNFFKGSFF